MDAPNAVRQPLALPREESEAPKSLRADHGRGGWRTFPYIIATVVGLTLAVGGWLSNLIVFLIEEFNIKRIDAVQINNVVYGCSSFFPVVGAVIADSFLGCFSVIWISSLISLLGLGVLVLTMTLDSLRPPPCEIGINGVCANTPSKIQYTVLYAALALGCIGMGGTRFTLATMGANQFSKPKQQATYFNWYFVSLYLSSVVASTLLVYVEDNVGWRWGFGISIVANVLGLAIFCLGKMFYFHHKPQGSPFTSFAHVIVASVRRRKERVSSQSVDYYYEDDGVKEMMDEPPTSSFRFLNRAALKTEGDIQPNGSTTKWKICTVEQVEDLKTLIRILPLWSSSFLLSITIGIQASLSVLQALTMDRRLSDHFKIPASSLIVFSLISTAIGIALFDHVIWPIWNKLVGPNPGPLKQIGTGHVINIVSMAVSALVEWRRRGVAASHPLEQVVSMSVLWLVPQLVIVGIGEALHFPGQVSLYYQEFPSSLKSMATAMISIIVGVGFYLSAVVIDFLRRVTEWLPDNINDGRVDNVYWSLVVLVVLNFGYFLVCSWMYKCKNISTSGGSGVTVF